MFKNLEMDFIPFIPFIPKTGKKISHQQEQFVKNNHAITAVPSHLCQRISLAGPWRFDWFQGQTWTNWKAAVSYTKKYVPFNVLPFAIKGYHFFKVIQSRPGSPRTSSHRETAKPMGASEP